MNRTTSQIDQNELARRLKEDAATWRIVPPADLRRRTMRTIARHEESSLAMMPDSARRAASQLAACALLAATSLLAIRLQAPTGDGGMTLDALRDLKAAADRAQVQVEQAQDMLGHSPLEQEMLALASDMEALTASVYRRVAWLDLRQN